MEISRKIITIIGSTKFRYQIKQFALALTKIQYHVLFSPFAKEEIPNLDAFREELEIQYFQKIRMADIVIVFDLDEYIGSTTQSELEYAKKIGKPIIFYSKIQDSWIEEKINMLVLKGIDEK